MKYKLLGRSGLHMSELAVGTITFGEDRGWGASMQESLRMLETYSEADDKSLVQFAIMLNVPVRNLCGNLSLQTGISSFL